MQFQNIDPAIDRFVNQRCFFYLQQVREQLNLAEINNENANLIIDNSNSLLFNVGNRTVFKINSSGHVYVDELFLDEEDLRTILNNIDTRINEVIQKLIYIISSEQFVTINNNLKLMGIIMNSNNDQFQLPIISPEDTSENIIALTKNLPDMSDVSFRSINETISGDKNFTGNVKLSGTISDANNNLLSLPNKAGTIALLDDIPDPIDTEPFVTKYDDQIINGMKTFYNGIICHKFSNDGDVFINVPRTIPDVSTMALAEDYLNMCTVDTAQNISAQKTFTTAPKISTNSLKSSSNYTVSIPNNTCTLATTNTAQTFSSTKTFSVAPKFSTNSLINSSNHTITLPNSTSTLATTNLIQTFTTDQTFSKTIKLNDGLRNSNGGSKITIPTSSGTMALTSQIPSVSGMVTLTGTQTLTNKTLTSPTINYPNFNNITSTKTWRNATYLNDQGTQYNIGKLHIYINATTHVSNKGGSQSYNNWFDVNYSGLAYKIPVFIQSQTWYGEKGMSAYINGNGNGYVIDTVGVAAGQYVYIFAIWVD